MINIELHITDHEFLMFKKLIYELLGINLNEHKKALLVSRLSTRIRELKLSSFTDYLVYINKSSEINKELTILTNRITTNETSFFRENHHFNFLANNVFNTNNSKELRVWSAGCSSGEEPYSIAMTSVDSKSRVKILASDINSHVLNIAKEGIYSNKIVKKSVPDKYLKYFNKIDDYSSQINNSIRQVITFMKINLIKDKFPIRVPLDIIFCRNVMIYFNNETKLILLDKFHEVLKENAYLIVGHSENLSIISNKFKLIDTTTYQKV